MLVANTKPLYLKLRFQHVKLEKYNLFDELTITFYWFLSGSISKKNELASNQNWLLKLVSSMSFLCGQIMKYINFVNCYLSIQWSAYQKCWIDKSPITKWWKCYRIWPNINLGKKCLNYVLLCYSNLALGECLHEILVIEKYIKIIFVYY